MTNKFRIYKKTSKKFRLVIFVQLRLLQFKKDMLAFNDDKFKNEIFIDDKFTQDTLDTLNNDIFDVTLYNVPVVVMSVQFIFVDVVLLLYRLF